MIISVLYEWYTNIIEADIDKMFETSANGSTELCSIPNQGKNS